MVTITQKTTNLQAEGLYGTVKLMGTVELNNNDIIVCACGSVCSKEGEALGNFRSDSTLSVTLNNRSDLKIISEVGVAIESFMKDVNEKIKKGL